MIARTWRGSVRASDAESYVDYLKRTGLADFGKTPGNLAGLALRRVSGDRAEFMIISLWDSRDAVRRFSGADGDVAVFYPEDERFLVERDEHVDHFEVVHFGSPDRNGNSEGAGVLKRLGALARWWLLDGAGGSGVGSQSVGRLTPHGFVHVRLP